MLFLSIFTAKDPDEASLTGSSRSDENEDGNYNDGECFNSISFKCSSNLILLDNVQ